MHQGDTRQDGLRQLAVLNRIARLALEDLDLGPMLQRIVDTLHDEFGWEFIAFARVDRERGEFCCEAVHSNADTSIAAGYRRALGSGVVGECALTGRTLDIEDTLTHPNFIDTMPGTRSELCVPIRHRGEVLAVLNVESLAPAAFRGQRALLETVADQIAGAIRAANLLSALQRANEELREAYAIVEAMSRNDSLTGIANRRRFDAWFAQAFEDARRTRAPLALVLADIDHFKAYNDGYGHLAGDECLRTIAATMAEALAGLDARLARYGGEEFAIVLAATPIGDAQAIAERLRLAVQASEVEHRHAAGGQVTISAGVAACIPSDDAVAADLFAAADRALYAAKDAGRNRTVAADGMQVPTLG
jgi:diguanylate cyclase (GGDEF)-like protein